jgi:hypothetical protein
VNRSGGGNAVADRSLHREAAALRLGFFALGFPVATWYSYAVHAQLLLGVRAAFWGLLLAVSAVAAIGAMRGYVRLPATRQAVVSTWAINLLPLSSAGLVLSPTVPVTAVLLALFGAAMGVVQVSLNHGACELEEQLTRPLLASCHGSFSIGVLAAGLIDFASAGTASSRVAITGSLLLVTVIRALFTRPMRRDIPSVAASSRPRDPAPRAPGHPHLAVAALVVTAVVLRLMEGAVNTWHSHLVDRELGFVGLGGAAYAAYAAGGILIRFVGDRARSRFGVLMTTSLLGPLAVLVFAAGLTGGHAAVVWPALVLLGAALGIAYPELLKLASLSPANVGARMVSLVLMGGTVGSLLANPLLGLLSEIMTVRGAFLLLDAVLACAFAYVTVRYLRWRRQRPGQPSRRESSVEG